MNTEQTAQRGNYLAPPSRSQSFLPQLHLPSKGVACAPSPPTQAPANTRPAFNLDLGTEHSIYSALATRLSQWYPDEDELIAILGRTTRRRSVFRLSPHALQRTCALLELEDSVFGRLAGRDIAPEQAHLALLHEELRYCPTCLGLRSHSALFQHRAVARCPIHDTPLRTGCPHCGMPIGVSLDEIARSPFSCDSCGSNFTDWQPPRARVRSEPFDAVRRALTPALPAESSVHRCATWWARLSRHAASVAPAFDRIVRRHAHWPEDSAYCGYASQYTLPLSVDGGSGVAHSVRPIAMRGEIQLDEPLRELLGILRKHCSAGSPPTGIEYAGARVLTSMTVAAAAFWSTVNAYVSISGFAKKRVAGTQVLAMRGDLPYGQPLACEALIRDELVGLMTRLLLTYSHLQLTAEIDWLLHPQPQRFVPAWRLVRARGAVALQVRPASSLARLEALIVRLGLRELQAVRYSPAHGCLMPISREDQR